MKETLVKIFSLLLLRNLKIEILSRLLLDQSALKKMQAIQKVKNFLWLCG